MATGTTPPAPAQLLVLIIHQNSQNVTGDLNLVNISQFNQHKFNIWQDTHNTWTFTKFYGGFEFSQFDHVFGLQNVNTSQFGHNTSNFTEFYDGCQLNLHFTIWWKEHQQIYINWSNQMKVEQGSIWVYITPHKDPVEKYTRNLKSDYTGIW